MPKGAHFLSFAVTRFGGPRLYMLVEPDKEIEERTFTAMAAGTYFNYDLVNIRRFIGTAVVPTGLQGELVCHFFEVVDPDQTKLEDG
jgi:hypothetical protein